MFHMRRTTSASRCRCRRSDKEVRDEVTPLLRIDGSTEHPIPGRGVRHGRAIETKQVRDGGGTQPRPVGDGARRVLFGEFGKGGNRQQDGEGITHAMRIAVVCEGAEACRERPD